MVVAEMEKLTSALEIGMSYLDYKKKLGEINYSVSVFLDRYQKYKEKIGYQAIEINMHRFKILGDIWQKKFEIKDSLLSSILENQLSEAFGIILKDMKLVRKIGEETNKENIANLTTALEENQKDWEALIAKNKDQIERWADFRIKQERIRQEYEKEKLKIEERFDYLKK